MNNQSNRRTLDIRVSFLRMNNTRITNDYGVWRYIKIHESPGCNLRVITYSYVTTYRRIYIQSDIVAYFGETSFLALADFSDCTTFK